MDENPPDDASQRHQEHDERARMILTLREALVLRTLNILTVIAYTWLEVKLFSELTAKLHNHQYDYMWLAGVIATLVLTGGVLNLCGAFMRNGEGQNLFRKVALLAIPGAVLCLLYPVSILVMLEPSLIG